MIYDSLLVSNSSIVYLSLLRCCRHFKISQVSPVSLDINCHAIFARAGMCWSLMFHVLNSSGVMGPFLWQHLNCGIIWPMKSGPHLWLTFSNPYWTCWRHIFFPSSYNIVLRHELSCGMAQYKSNDWLIDWTQILDHPHRPLPSLGDFLQI